MGKKYYKKYIKRAWDYFQNYTKVVPSPEDIINDVIFQLEDNGGMVTDDDYKEIEKEVGRDW